MVMPRLIPKMHSYYSCVSYQIIFPLACTVNFRAVCHQKVVLVKNSSSSFRYDTLKHSAGSRVKGLLCL